MFIAEAIKFYEKVLMASASVYCNTKNIIFESMDSFKPAFNK